MENFCLQYNFSFLLICSSVKHASLFTQSCITILLEGSLNINKAAKSVSIFFSQRALETDKQTNISDLLGGGGGGVKFCF